MNFAAKLFENAVTNAGGKRKLLGYVVYNQFDENQNWAINRWPGARVFPFVSVMQGACPMQSVTALD